MLGKKKISELLNKALRDGSSTSQLAKSAAIGVYIAFSPFPGAHTVMMFIFKFFLRLNFPILFLATSINNPWTMIPFFSLDYAFGYWLVHHVLGWSPGFSIPLHSVFGSGSICVWSFLIGGNILGIVSAFMCYPLFRIMFSRVFAAKEKTEIFVQPACRDVLLPIEKGPGDAATVSSRREAP